MSFEKLTHEVYLLLLALIILGSAFMVFNCLHEAPVAVPGEPTPAIDAAPSVNNDNDTVGGLRYRWVYVRDELDVPGNLEKVQDLMRRAKADGYNGIVFSNLWSQNNLENLDRASPDYINKLNALKGTADSLGLELYPAILTVGYASPMLARDPNLVEGLPVKDALYIANKGEAVLSPDPPVSLPGGDFESSAGDVLNGWDSQSWPGTNTFADTAVKHSGRQSLRVETKGISRVYKTIDVSPYRQYVFSFWIKTEGVVDTAAMEPTITGADGRQLAFPGPIAESTQDWKKVDIVFDSLDNRQVTISLGTWDWHGGTIWFDDARLQEIGMVNIIRRSEYPLTVAGEDGTVYAEGIDYEPVSDPILGVSPSPGYYSICHQAPAIRLTENSRIKDGERLRASYYVVGTTYGGQVAISLTSPEARALFKKEIITVNKVLKPRGFFINYDEIRAGNWEARPVPMTEGQAIADSFVYVDDVIHALNPGLKIFVWNDMFDPYHNAKDNMCLINGTCDGSYKGLSRDVVVVNWHYEDNRTESLKFFSGLGNPQIIAGYYDGDAPSIRQWLDEAKSVNASVEGVMYTTWNSDYSQLEAFAGDAWGNSSS